MTANTVLIANVIKQSNLWLKGEVSELIVEYHVGIKPTTSTVASLTGALGKQRSRRPHCVHAALP